LQGSIAQTAAKDAFLMTKQGIDLKNTTMNSQRTGLYVAALIFAIVALGHAIRLLTQAKVVVATHSIPMGLSWVGLVVACGLSIWMWRLAAGNR
jgi:hypothetical protein